MTDSTDSTTTVLTALANPTFWAALAAAVGAISAAVVSVVNAFKNSSNHQANMDKLVQQDGKLETIRADVNNNLTVANNKLDVATSQLAETHATIATLVAAQTQNGPQTK